MSASKKSAPLLYNVAAMKAALPVVKEGCDGDGDVGYDALSTVMLNNRTERVTGSCRNDEGCSCSARVQCQGRVCSMSAMMSVVYDA